jgi:hypothetical protein
MTYDLLMVIEIFNYGWVFVLDSGLSASDCLGAERAILNARFVCEWSAS